MLPALLQVAMADKGHDHRAIWCGIQAILRLGRMKMTVFSAVTYGAAASLAGMSELDSGLFLAGWVFVFFTQMVAHFLGEYPRMQTTLQSRSSECSKHVIPFDSRGTNPKFFVLMLSSFGFYQIMPILTVYMSMG